MATCQTSSWLYIMWKLFWQQHYVNQ